MALTLAMRGEAQAMCNESLPPARNLKSHDAVFTCEVTKLVQREDRLEARVRILKAWKGVLPGETANLWGRAPAGNVRVEDTFRFSPKEQFLVFADSCSSGWCTDACDGSRLLDKRDGATEIIEALGPSLAKHWWKFW